MSKMNKKGISLCVRAIQEGDQLFAGFCQILYHQ